ncbi:sentrin-specific protease 5-like [Ostrea edulis]|nr:sentrin-specific protease 5-like [Ostrea edulis]
MGIDLYEVDIRSLNPMRWLTDAVIDVVARRMKEQIPSKNVYILETFFAQKLLVKGKLNRRPLDMTGCNYLGVENVLAALDVDLEKGAILIVPISNMVHWYLAVLCAESRSIYFLCSMNGRYENEGASLKV